ncbi:MAG: VC2046/SO_2500 family protein [Parashewanella sp.]
MQVAQALINELDVGTSLNTATVSNRRRDFSLILSLMSQDVRDMAQFQLVEQPNENAQLRKKFRLPKEQVLIADLSESPKSVTHAAAFQSQGLTAFRLNNSIQPEALVNRGKLGSQLKQVLENCDVHVARKHLKMEIEQPNTSTPFIDLLEKQRTLSKIIALA